MLYWDAKIATNLIPQPLANPHCSTQYHQKHPKQQSTHKNPKRKPHEHSHSSKYPSYQVHNSPDPQDYIFLQNYVIMPHSEKYQQPRWINFHAGKGRRSRDGSLMQKIRYRKIQKGVVGVGNGRRNWVGTGNGKVQIQYGFCSKIQDKQYQRNEANGENSSKKTPNFSITRNPTNPYINSSPFLQSFTLSRQKNTQKQTKPSLSSNSSQINFNSFRNLPSNPNPNPNSTNMSNIQNPTTRTHIRCPHEAPIPQEYESSQSRTNRNYSSISPSSHTHSHRSSRSRSHDSIGSIGKMSSIRSSGGHGGSMKSHRNSGTSKSIRGSLRSSLKNSIFLPINSIKRSSNPEEFDNNMEQLEGYIIIENYLELLNIVANYANQITENYENTEDWQQLIFLTYKKYYLYRLKLFNALFYRNTLFFEYDPATGNKLPSHKRKQLKNFMNSENGQTLRKQVYKENQQIVDSLRNIYNLAIEKSGNFINMEQVDNFSCQIYRLIIQEIQELGDNFYREPELVKQRLKAIVRCIMAIAKLDRKIQQEKMLNGLMQGPIGMPIFEKIVNFINQRLI